MAEESHSFTAARARLEEIVTQVRKKDTSLEKSLDLLEEGVRLANACTELIDHADWTAGAVPGIEESGLVTDAVGGTAHEAPEVPEGETIVVDSVAVIEDVVVVDEDGAFVAEVIEVAEYSADDEAGDDFRDADDAWSDAGSSTGAAIPDDDAVNEPR